jgi:hypothetical protein
VTTTTTMMMMMMTTEPQWTMMEALTGGLLVDTPADLIPVGQQGQDAVDEGALARALAPDHVHVHKLLAHGVELLGQLADVVAHELQRGIIIIVIIIIIIVVVVILISISIIIIVIIEALSCVGRMMMMIMMMIMIMMMMTMMMSLGRRPPVSWA